MKGNPTDLEGTEAEVFERLKGELQQAFAAPHESYQKLDADSVIARLRGDPSG